VIPELARRHHVLAMDQIGFGNSDKPFIDYSVQTYVDSLGEFLRTLKVDHFDLAGESLGGRIAASYTLQALSLENSGPYALPRPERLILEDAAGHTDPFHRAGAQPQVGPIPISGNLKDAAGVAIVFHDKSRVTEEFIRRDFALKMKANDGMTERLFTSNPRLSSEVVGDKLGGITIPTLVVWGENDELVPLADGRDYAAKIPNARLVIVSECGHAPSIEKPQQFIDAVERFLKAR
jgi:pimeloyl-ACP methyl ester carboxylesterase